MEVLYSRCAGLDVHTGSVTACARIASGPDVTYEHRTVPTTTRGPLELAEWLTTQGCTHVAMEATGVLRIQKTLEEANLKLTQVMSNIVGVSGRAILNALIAGETHSDRLADLTQGRLKAPWADLLDALHGRVTDHHRFMLKLHLTQIDTLETGFHFMKPGQPRRPAVASRSTRSSSSPVVQFPCTIPNHGPARCLRRVRGDQSLLPELSPRDSNAAKAPARSAEWQ